MTEREGRSPRFLTGTRRCYTTAVHRGVRRRVARGRLQHASTSPRWSGWSTWDLGNRVRPGCPAVRRGGHRRLHRAPSGVRVQRPQQGPVQAHPRGSPPVPRVPAAHRVLEGPPTPCRHRCRRWLACVCAWMRQHRGLAAARSRATSARSRPSSLPRATTRRVTPQQASGPSWLRVRGRGAAPTQSGSCAPYASGFASSPSRGSVPSASTPRFLPSRNGGCRRCRATSSPPSSSK